MGKGTLSQGTGAMCAGGVSNLQGVAILNLTILLATSEVIRSYINFEDNNFSLGHKNEGSHFSTYGDQHFVQQQNGHGCFRRKRDYDHGSGLSYKKHRQAETSRLQ